LAVVLAIIVCSRNMTVFWTSAPIFVVAIVAAAAWGYYYNNHQHRPICDAATAALFAIMLLTWAMGTRPNAQVALADVAIALVFGLALANFGWVTLVWFGAVALVTVVAFQIDFTLVNMLVATAAIGLCMWGWYTRSTDEKTWILGTIGGAAAGTMFGLTQNYRSVSLVVCIVIGGLLGLLVAFFINKRRAKASGA
jgi:hypothetical protein